MRSGLQRLSLPRRAAVLPSSSSLLARRGLHKGESSALFSSARFAQNDDSNNQLHRAACMTRTELSGPTLISPSPLVLRRRFFSTDKETEIADDAAAAAASEAKEASEDSDKAAAAAAAAASDSDSSDESSDEEDGVAESAKEKPPKPEPPKIEFKAETKQILDIMTNSLYTDKEVFLRELVSNASDALEKLRHAHAANLDVKPAAGEELEIRIECDEVTNSVTITDTGIGMTADEMIYNLGTIAQSGSRQFLKEMQRVQEHGGNQQDFSDPARGIIGKFGVGFYSVFMIADRVQVISSSSWNKHADLPPQMWNSSGDGFTVTDVEEGIRVPPRGTSVQMFLKPGFAEFCSEIKLEQILKRYSNFVGFPIYLMGKKVNTIDALWARDPKTIDDDLYRKFYQYISSAVDDPMQTIHFRADAPLDVKALFFIPSFHSEKYDMARMEPSVNLYCRKVLIEAKSPDILPDWLRFLKGMVDSEDLPLAISREKTQDSALIQKLRTALTRKFLSHMAKLQKDDRDTFVNEFYREYQHFLKEGICNDHEFQPQLSKLLYFESNKHKEVEIFTLDEYVARMRPEQKEIYYLCAPNREAAISSPYMETFTKAGVEVLFVFTALDDFVLTSLQDYQGRKIVSVERSDVQSVADLKKKVGRANEPDEDSDRDKDGYDEADSIYKADKPLTPEESVDFCNWMRDTFSSRIVSCSVTDRLYTSPAIVTDHESGAMRKMMQMVGDGQKGGSGGVPNIKGLARQHVEVNPKHSIIVGIHHLRKTEPALARGMAEQVFENCLVAAGLLDDNRAMIPRINDFMICIVRGATQNKGQVDFSHMHKKQEMVAAAQAKEAAEMDANEEENLESMDEEITAGEEEDGEEEVDEVEYSEELMDEAAQVADAADETAPYPPKGGFSPKAESEPIEAEATSKDGDKDKP